MFKHLNAIKIVLYIYIIFCFKQCKNQGNTTETDIGTGTDTVTGTDIVKGNGGEAGQCNYTNNELSEYLNVTDDEEKKRRCFDLSYNFKNNICCYDETKKTCYNVTETEISGNLICPQNASIPNNCGLAGLNQPVDPSVCKEISLVQGYCCYVTIKVEGQNEPQHSCLRTKKLAKVKDEASEQIKNYIEKIQETKKTKYEIGEVDCWNFNIQYFWLSNLIINIILLLL